MADKGYDNQVAGNQVAGNQASGNQVAGKDEPCRECSARMVSGTEVGCMERTGMVVAGEQLDMADGSIEEGTDIEVVDGLEAADGMVTVSVTEEMKMKAGCSLEEHFLWIPGVVLLLHCHLPSHPLF